MTHVYKIHKRDPNFPASAIERIEEFLSTLAFTSIHAHSLI